MNAAHDLPHPFDGLALATQDLSGIACAVHDGTVPVIKQQPSDFLVEEALYHPSGDGEHLYLYVQKSRLTTHSQCTNTRGAFSSRWAERGIRWLEGHTSNHTSDVFRASAGTTS